MATIDSVLVRVALQFATQVVVSLLLSSKALLSTRSSSIDLFTCSYNP